MTVTESDITASILGASASTSMSVTGYNEGNCGPLTYTATMTDEYPTIALEDFLSFDADTQTLTLTPLIGHATGTYSVTMSAENPTYASVIV